MLFSLVFIRLKIVNNTICSQAPCVYSTDFVAMEIYTIVFSILKCYMTYTYTLFILPKNHSTNKVS